MGQSLSKDEIYLLLGDIFGSQAAYSNTRFTIEDALDVVERLAECPRELTKTEILKAIELKLVMLGHVYQEEHQKWVHPDDESSPDETLYSFEITPNQSSFTYKVELTHEGSTGNGYMITTSMGGESECYILGSGSVIRYRALSLYNALVHCSTQLWDASKGDVEQFQTSYAKEKHQHALTYFSKAYTPMDEVAEQLDAQQAFAFLIKWDVLNPDNLERPFMN